MQNFLSLCTWFVDAGERRALTENVRLRRSQVELSFFTLDDAFLDDFCHATRKRVDVQRSIVKPW